MKYKDTFHFSHRHELKPETNQSPFTCDGCKQAGFGLRFSCDKCKYYLHRDCTLNPSSIAHPLFSNSTFRFHEKVEGKLCDACGKPSEGFAYASGRRMLHPCCATLPLVFHAKGIELHLQKHVWSKCCKCLSRNLFGSVRGWSYKSTCKQYHFHVSCVKDLVDDWKNHSAQRIDVTSVIPKFKDRWRTYSWWKGKMKDKFMSIDAVLNINFSIVLGDSAHITDFFIKTLASKSFPILEN